MSFFFTFIKKNGEKLKSDTTKNEIEWRRKKRLFFHARIEVDWVLSIPIYWNAVDYKIIEIFLFIASAFLFYFSRFMSSWDIYGWINFISHLFTASPAVVMEWKRDRLNDMWDIENYRGIKEEKKNSHQMKSEAIHAMKIVRKSRKTIECNIDAISFISIDCWRIQSINKGRMKEICTKR